MRKKNRGSFREGEREREGRGGRECRVAEPVAGLGFAGAVKLAVRPVAVDPGVGQVEIGKDFFQAAQGKGTVVRDGPGFGVVRPGAGILQIEDLMAEGAEAQKVLQIVPDDPTEGVLADEAGDDDAHLGILGEEEKSWKFS